MKLLFTILLVLTLSKECKSSQNITSQPQEEITIIYQAVTRGFFEEIKYQNKQLTYCNDINRKIHLTYPFDINDWEALLELLSKVELNTLPALESPTNMRQYDGAPHATLTIEKGDEKITSSTFDHGYPPSSIKPLVEKLISIKKMTIKQ